MIYATTDLHGNYDLWKQIQNYLQEDDKLIFLGDAIDRGDRGFEIFMEMLDDPRVIFIKGNHEDIMYWAYNSSGYYSREHLKNWHRNGGRATQKNMNDLIDKGVITFEEAMSYIQKIDDLPTYIICPIEDSNKIIYLTHAGFTPSPQLLDLSEIMQEKLLLWDRKHIGDSWPQQYPNIYILHGHTPIQSLPLYGQKAWDPNIGLTSYANEHKICLDLGTISSQTAVLYCLNTMSVATYFSTQSNTKEN